MTNDEAFKTVFLPMVDKYGIEKACRIAELLGPIFEAMSGWPKDIREDCFVEFMRVVELGKSESKNELKPEK